VAYDARMPTDLILLLVIILVVVLIWRGPKILPEWGAALGRGVREARSNATKGLDDTKTTTRELSDGTIETTTTTISRRDTTDAPRP
jgi:Sec-independent protein translocase protein TatA